MEQADLEKMVRGMHDVAFHAAIDLEQLLPHAKLNGRGFSHAKVLAGAYSQLSGVPDEDIKVGNYASQLYHHFDRALNYHIHPIPEFILSETRSAMVDFSNALAQLPQIEVENFTPHKMYYLICALAQNSSKPSV